MIVCHFEDKSIDRIIYILKPVITDEIFGNFIKEFKAVPNSEYECLVMRIARLLFYCGENISLLYENFYSDEYDSFSEFLEIELGFDEEEIKNIIEQCCDDESLWRIDIADFETYNFMTLFDSKTWDEEALMKKINIALLRSQL